MSKELKISIIIPVLHYKRPVNAKRFFMPRQTLAETLADIKKNVQIKHEIIVVCNGQDPVLINYVSTHPDIDRYSINSENVGVSRSWNMGAQLANTEVLCYLNDDVSLGVDALETLYELLMSSTNIGQVGPEGVFWKNGKLEGFVKSTQPANADAILGYCFMMRASTFYKVGGFDIAYSPAGCEDIDMSYKIRSEGFKCVVDSNVKIKHFHHHGVSAQKVDITYLGETIDTEALHLRNIKYLKDKWGAN